MTPRAQSIPTRFSDYAANLRSLIRTSPAPSVETSSRGNSIADPRFNALALELFQLQFDTVAPYRTYCSALKKTPDSVDSWLSIPAMPSRAFKEWDLTSLPPAEQATVFHSSGTSGRNPSRHFHSAESLSLYHDSLIPWFEFFLLPTPRPESATNRAKLWPMIFLAPPPDVAPHSSLVHMFETIRAQLGSSESRFIGKLGPDGAWLLDYATAEQSLAQAASRPTLFLGTAFSFVHLMDHMAQGGLKFSVAAGSRVMETGGYKGRSRVIAKSELHQLISTHLAVPESQIVSEFGSSELSSQAYDRIAGDSGSRRLFRFPPWARARILSMEDGSPVGFGKAGLLEVIDLANARSVLAVQTGDLAVAWEGGFELLGRAELSDPRGCSLLPG